MLRTIVRVAVVVTLLWAWLWLMENWATPEQCRVPYEQMSAFCLDLVLD
jgi:hypothetical protein